MTIHWRALTLLLATACGGEDDTAPVQHDGGAVTDGGEDLDTDTTAEVDCDALDPATCKREASCRVIYAFAIVPATSGEYCVENEEKFDVGCTFADTKCACVTSWSADPASSDQCYIFHDCKPAGWGQCAEAAMRTTVPC